MTLDEMLALLPDNTTGEIGADDLRAIVTGLHEIASSVAQVFPYLWVNNTGPAVGKVNVTPWSEAATILAISETTDDGQALSFGVLDNASNAQVRIFAAGGSRLLATITGPSIDQGGYRNLPITVDEVSGPTPGTSEKCTVMTLVTP